MKKIKEWFLHFVIKCDNIDHNMLINYDGECGYCGGTKKK